MRPAQNFISQEGWGSRHAAWMLCKGNVMAINFRSIKAGMATLILFVFLSGCCESPELGGLASGMSENPDAMPQHMQVGFFAPGSVRETYAPKVDIQLYEASTPERLEEALSLASAYGLKLFVALPFPEKNKEQIAVEYQLEGKTYTKTLPFLDSVKVSSIYPKEDFYVYAKPYFDLIKKHPSTVEAIFLGDEPYLNGVGYKELEIVGEYTRELLDAYELQHVKLGVVFASAMFNADFAKHLNAAASNYVYSIDKHYASLKEKERAGLISDEELNWLKIISRVRLTTYDQAGNMYVDGGVPDIVDIIGFDFYTSTLLLDGLHNTSLDWFSRRKLHPSCSDYNGADIKTLRQELFFWDAKNKQQTYTSEEQAERAASDKRILDGWYVCRTASVLELLNQEIARSGRADREILLVSESSTNGFLEFDLHGNTLPDQDFNLVHSRVVDEVARAFQLSKEYSIDHLLFFTYETQSDYSINLVINGAEDIPEALELIYQNARRSE